jgi:sporulation protein YlmC with PRC-barrel domain
MSIQESATLRNLSDTDLTVATSEEDIRGRTVKDKDGKDIGKIDDLLIDDRERKVRFMRVESGGFLGLGETKVFIPIEVITRITDDEVSIDQSREHVAAAPRYTPDLVDKPDYYGEIYGHYGYPSF